MPTTNLVKNTFFYGEDSIKGKDIVFIMEGVTDCLAALQHGLPSISPVTVQFKKSDHPKLLSLVRGKKVFLVPDNEENEAGIKGAQETQAFLKNNGIEAHIIALPRPAGKDKVDFNEYVRDHGIEAFRRLVEAAPEWKAQAPDPAMNGGEWMGQKTPNRLKILPHHRRLTGMNSELSSLQKEILHLAFEKNFVTCEDLLANLWGRKGQEPGTKESAIGKGQYASAHASLSRSLTRLWMKNLIIYWKTLTRYRTGISLTPAGTTLAQAILADGDNEQ